MSNGEPSDAAAVASGDGAAGGHPTSSLTELSAPTGYTRTTGESDDEAGPPRLGTFLGVFTPTVLTILGVIMYLRLGWVVGHGGLLGALLIVAFSNAITAVTALSMSALATNMRVDKNFGWGEGRTLGSEE